MQDWDVRIKQISEMLDIHTTMSASERRKRAIEIMDMVHLPDPEKTLLKFSKAIKHVLKHIIQWLLK